MDINELKTLLLCAIRSMYPRATNIPIDDCINIHNPPDGVVVIIARDGELVIHNLEPHKEKQEEKA